MHSWQTTLAAILNGHTALVGVGNPEHGDDGAGVALAEELRAAGCANVFVAGATPEETAPVLARLGFERLLLMDAVEFGGQPGDTILLSSREIQSRFPQISTHKLSLGTLARMIEAERGVQVWLLGLQPAALKGSHLSPAMQATVQTLSGLLRGLLHPPPMNAAQPIPKHGVDS